jgi:hypothetical protein
MQPIVWTLSLTLLGAPAEKADEPKEFEPALVKMQALAADPKDDPLHKLLKERFNAALGETQALYQRAINGVSSFESLFDAANRMKHAGLEALDDPKDKIALLEKFIELAKHVEKIAEIRQEKGRIGAEELYRMRYCRADAEIALLRLKSEKPK